MKTIMPNPSLIKYFIENYYRDSEIKSQESQFVSSHWKHYGGLFNVKADEKGNPVLLSGKAIGAARWKGSSRRHMDQLCILSHLVHLCHRREIIRLRAIATKVCDTMGLNMTISVFRQVCSLALLQRNIPADMGHKRIHVLMIGDGYGVLSALFKTVFPNSTIVMIDIGKTLLFQTYYCQKAHSKCVHERSDILNDLDSVDFVYCPTENLETLERFKFDIAVNIASMQEMNASTIARYFAFFRKQFHPKNLFYCCNREFKTLLGGEVSEFFKYPWQDSDQYLIDGRCPWHQYFFSRGRTENGLHLFGARVPFVNFYDGKHVHRLAVLTTK